ncbi:hypothetical protein A5662_22655 [Mycobacteriaceae bacterium 1482268.1]|nr:hypothetical protein A5662_22655 [Mycobacteriaceae bacterium 1482268.1]
MMVAMSNDAATNSEAEPADDAPPSQEPEPSQLAKLQHEVRVATRSARYALAAAVLAAVISAGVSAWASVRVSSTQMDRQERLAQQQAVRADRQKAYINLATAYMELGSRLGEVQAQLLAMPPSKQGIVDSMAKLQPAIQALSQSEAAVRIVGSEMGPLLARFDDAQLALYQGEGSLQTVTQYLSDHDGLDPDPNWPRIRGAGLAAIEKFMGDNSINEFAERAREDLGTG